MTLRKLALGGRIFLRDRATTCVSNGSFSGPWGPFYFLYPRWIQTAGEVAEGKGDDSRQPLSTRDPTTSHNKALAVTEDRQAASFVRKIVKHIGKRAARSAYNSRARKEYQEWKHMETSSPPPDWRKILHDLELHTPDQSAVWHDKALRILVPIRAADQLLFSQDDNIWAIKDEFGCHVELSQAEEQKEGFRTLLLSGTATSIAKAATKILGIVPNAVQMQQTWPTETLTFSTESPSGDSTSSINGSPPIRYVLANPYRSMAIPLRADQVKRPSIWTPTSFGNYVKHLTRIEMPTYIHSNLYKPGENHYNMVVSILRALFADPDCQEAISVTALNDTIAYLTKHSYIKTVREIFVRVETLDLKMNTVTFNIMLRSAAKSEDLTTFHFILGLMRSRGCTPDGRTWLAFFSAVKPVEIKLHVLTGMKRKGFLNDITMQRHVCEQLIVYEIETALEEKLSQREFNTRMRGRYGSSWLTVSTANRILNVLGSRGLISRCWEMLEYMDAQNINPDSVSINTLLHHCGALGNLDGAMEIVRRLFSVHKFAKDENTYRFLFDMAWNYRLYAVARVVWRYACLDASTSFRMRKRINDSVRTALGDASLNGTRWNATAGPFILGAISSTTPEELSLQIPSPTSPLKPSTLSALNHINNKGSGNNIEVRKWSKQAVVAAIQTNLDVFQTWIPEKPFADVLIESFERDMEWRALSKSFGDLVDSKAHESSDETYGLDWLNERAPVITLRKRVGFREGQRAVEWA
jgi:pentatricopeptide repeat protein